MKKLVKVPEGRIELHNENGQMQCPYATKIPLQKGNTIEILPIPCCNYCPHFHYRPNNDKGYHFKITCSGSEVEIEVPNTIEERKIHQPNFQPIK